MAAKKDKRNQRKLAKFYQSVMYGVGSEGRMAEVAQRIDPTKGRLMGCEFCKRGGHTGDTLYTLSVMESDKRGARLIAHYFCKAHYLLVEKESKEHTP